MTYTLLSRVYVVFQVPQFEPLFRRRGQVSYLPLNVVRAHYAAIHNVHCSVRHSLFWRDVSDELRVNSVMHIVRITVFVLNSPVEVSFRLGKILARA